MLISKKEKMELFKKRMDFMGYGNPNGDIWVIGMEEGCKKENQYKNLIKKFKASKNRRYMDTDDTSLPSSHRNWHKNGARLQSTLRVLYIILNGLEGNKIVSDKDVLRNYQTNKFGKLDGNHFSADLSPYPSHSSDDWPTLYKELGFDRKYLEEVIIPKRIKLFKILIKKYEPVIIIFYSFGYLKYWKQIVESDFKRKDDIYVSSNNKYFVIKQPRAFDTNKYWVNVAKHIKNILKGNEL